MKLSSRRVTIIIGLALIFIIMIAIKIGSPMERYMAQTSPDGAYIILVLRQPALFAMMPGQSGDAPGVVQLIDGEGNILHQEPIEMVNLLGIVKWSENTVIVPPLGEWKLE